MIRIIILTTFLLGWSLPQVSAQYQVGHQSLTLLDASRQDCGLFGCSDRSVTTEVYYPATTAGDNVPVSTGEFPLIVFGHGFSMAWSEYKVWWDSLATKGYVVVFPTTEASAIPFPSHPDFAEDMSFLIDEFLAMNTDPASDFYQHLTEKTGMMGHSMGGGCAFTAALNPNVTTLVSMTAAETNDVSAIGNAANLSIPSLTLAGTADCVVMDGGAPIDMYNNHAPTPYHAFVDIYDASHCQFGIASSGSICTLGESCSGFLAKAEQHEQMTLSALPWLDFFLKDDCQAWLDFRAHAVGGNTITHDFLEGGDWPRTVRLAGKVFLEGPYQVNTGLMKDSLRTRGFLPTVEPFTDLGFNMVYAGGEEIAPSVLAVAGNDAIVDWLFLELRDRFDDTLVVSSKVALLQRDGDIVDLDGISPLAFPCAEPESYYVVINHRNHLSIISEMPVALTFAPITLDFTSSATPVLGATPRIQVDAANGIYALWTADSEPNGQVNAADRSNVWNERNSIGYKGSDFTLDGQVDAADRSKAWNNRNKFSYVP